MVRRRKNGSLKRKAKAIADMHRLARMYSDPETRPACRRYHRTDRESTLCAKCGRWVRPEGGEDGGAPFSCVRECFGCRLRPCVLCVACCIPMLPYETGNVCPSCWGDFFRGYWELQEDGEPQFFLPTLHEGPDAERMRGGDMIELITLTGPYEKLIPGRQSLSRSHVLQEIR